MTVEGEWNDKMFSKLANENVSYFFGYSSFDVIYQQKTELFIDVNAMPILRKMVQPRTEQLEYESRR